MTQVTTIYPHEPLKGTVSGGDETLLNCAFLLPLSFHFEYMVVTQKHLSPI